MNRDVCGICWCPYDDNGACECKTLDDAMQQPRAMAQAYESGYKAGVANEREACAKVCDFHVARLSAIDEPRPALAVGICAAAIRARGNT